MAYLSKINTSDPIDCFGLVEITGDEDKFDKNLSLADRTLYKAKDLGRNRVEVYQ